MYTNFMPIIGFPATFRITMLFQAFTIPQADRKKRRDLFAMQIVADFPPSRSFLSTYRHPIRRVFWGYSQQDRIDYPQKSCYKIGYSPLS